MAGLVDLIQHRGGCHCGRVRFEVSAPAEIEVSECNCSICAKSGFLHLIVPRARFNLTCGGEYLTTYTFNTGVAKHLFCSICGIKSFYVPRSNPDGYSVLKVSQYVTLTGQRKCHPSSHNSARCSRGNHR
jgi:hypothetical protein